jgi:hypothetical protein
MSHNSNAVTLLEISIKIATGGKMLYEYLDFPAAIRQTG